MNAHAATEPRTDPATRRALRVQYRNHSAVIAAVDDADALAGALADAGRLGAALAWYADELHYSRLVGDMPGTPSPVIADGGAIARAALAAASGTAAPMARNRATMPLQGAQASTGRSVPAIAPDQAVAPEIERGDDGE